MKKAAKKPPYRIYGTIVAVTASVMILTGVVAAWASYPTDKHRDIAAQQQALFDKNSTTFPLEVATSKEYVALTETPEGSYSSTADWVSTFVQFIAYVILVGLVYSYLRRHNVSATRRALGATALLTATGNLLAAFVLQFPNAYFTAAHVTWNLALFVGYIASFAVGLMISFVIAWIFERGYNKRHSFTVD